MVKIVLIVNEFAWCLALNETQQQPTLSTSPPPAPPCPPNFKQKIQASPQN